MILRGKIASILSNILGISFIMGKFLVTSFIIGEILGM